MLGQTDPWKIQARDVIVMLDNTTGAPVLHRYLVLSVPVVDWPNAATAVRCEEDGLLTSFILQHDEKVTVVRPSDHQPRRAWTRRKELQS